MTVPASWKWCHSHVELKFAPKTTVLLCVFDRVVAQPLLFAIVILSFLRQREQNHMFSKGSAQGGRHIKGFRAQPPGQASTYENMLFTIPALMTVPASWKWCHSHAELKFAPKTTILLCVFHRVVAQPLLFTIVILSFLRQREQNHMFSKGSAGADGRTDATLKASELSLLGKPVRMRI